MSEQSEREWKSYLLSKGVFGNALRFAHLEKPEEVDRTSSTCVCTNAVHHELMLRYAMDEVKIFGRAKTDCWYDLRPV